jgi:uncharacterized protein
MKEKERRLPGFLDVPWSVRDLVVFVLAWIGIQLVLAVVVGVLAHFVPAVHHLTQQIVGGDVVVGFGLDLVNAATAMGVISLYLRKYGVGWQALGWRRVSLLKAVGYILAVLVVFIMTADLLIWLVSVLVPSFNPNQAQQNDFITSRSNHHDIAIIALVLLPPVLEESIFRGFIFPALAKRTGLVWGAILSSAVFGFAHLQANIGIYTFVLGLVLCFMYVRLKSIIPGMALHMLNNCLAFIALSQK